MSDSEDEKNDGAAPAPAPAEASEKKRVAPKTSDNIYSSAVFLTMENVLEKLKVLDYETTFCVKHHITPLARTSFALPAKNPSVQFKNFLDLVSWLCGEATGDPDTFTVDQFDDPNVSVNKMMLALRNLGFSLDFPVTKLKQGHGEPTCNVLDFLVDKALAARGFQWQPPLHEDAPDLDEAEVDEAADIGDAIEDDIEDIEEEEAMFTEVAAPVAEAEVEDQAAREMITGTIDALEWKTELERVGPRLKLPDSLMSKEWRAHIEQTKEHEKRIQSTLPTAQGHMQSMSGQIKDAVEKMRSKEQSINNQFESIRQEYESARGEMKVIEDKVTATRTNVNELTNSMNSITEQLDELKDDMSSRENSATDTSPLIQIKQALQGIKGDVNSFELRIGVVSHTLMQAKLKSIKTKHRGNKSKDPDEDDLFEDDELEYS
mmetsp:Transcript_15607/g.27884  ORF Transcript_15607/g.27884 Transcript_15607/m.27884 type:complete len:433 (+) Transcript_15607:14-1312(+)|eukprot:CAMPEP_0205905990 /NCGR_PEP_ID=MMETSP1325-20131115/1676_1 /ASSEMBLY_ACC=CAM_ASM_000708 /TAXON_ID=236786 /ORGANISM="Florenciella sp., Strain RCC1007" /LENGTH=432 /DNA_ID=CAMNT_0053271957 /DNA_START=14 /DNA_END=1312 /DNA_ORIENTATION=-